jgi:hypothetical protein
LSLGRYTLITLALASTSLALTWWVLDSVFPSGRWAAMLGGGIATLNSLAAYGLVVWSAGRSNTAFFRTILGGMLVRMTAMLGVVVAAVVWLGVPRLPLTLSLLAYFVVFLAFEMAAVHRSQPVRAGFRR